MITDRTRKMVGWGIVAGLTFMLTVALTGAVWVGGLYADLGDEITSESALVARIYALWFVVFLAMTAIMAFHLFDMWRKRCVDLRDPAGSDLFELPVREVLATTILLLVLLIIPCLLWMNYRYWSSW